MHMHMLCRKMNKFVAHVCSAEVLKKPLASPDFKKK